MKRKNMKYRPCIGRTISLSILSFMLFFVTIAGIFPSVEREYKNIVFFIIIFFFILHVLLLIYSLLKLNSPICLDESKISQKQYGKEIEIYYAYISNVKLSFAYYGRAPYAIKIYDNKKMIMFEITSKCFDEFMKYCTNVEVKKKIESLLREKEIY